MATNPYRFWVLGAVATLRCTMLGVLTGSSSTAPSPTVFGFSFDNRTNACDTSVGQKDSVIKEMQGNTCLGQDAKHYEQNVSGIIPSTPAVYVRTFGSERPA
jgi:hypothetical protein